MNIVSIKGINIGEGKPKICVPIVGDNMETIINAAKVCKGSAFDIVEWRGDFFSNIYRPEAVKEILLSLREIFIDKVLLFTLRTSAEGGECNISPEEYMNINKLIIDSGLVDMVDVEIYIGNKYVTELIRYAHENGVKVIGSNHDFDRTPDKEIIISRLCLMQEYGVDVAKIAVMPLDESDVMTLLSATLVMKEMHDVTPVVTMSMSKLGVISRLIGQFTGSAITFGAAGRASAPGQIDVEDLNNVLDIIDKS